MTAPSQFGPGVFFLCHVLVSASNHWCVGELLPPVRTIHGVWGTQNRLEEVLVDLQWEREWGGCAFLLGNDCLHMLLEDWVNCCTVAS